MTARASSLVVRVVLALGVFVGTTVCRIGPAAADEATCVAATETSLTLRSQGKLHDALKQLAVCTDPSCSSEVRQECSQRVQAIDAVMPTVIFGAKDGAGNDLSAVTVTMDGAPLLTVLDGRPVSLDPGPHTFRFETAGTPPVDKQLVLREGDRDRQEAIVLGTAPAAASSRTTLVTPTPAHESSFWTGRRVIAASGVGVGVAGVVVGAILGAYALSAKSDETSNCSASSCKNAPQANEDYTTAHHDATGATVAFIAGGALIAGGAVLWLTAPKRPTGSATSSASITISPWLGSATSGLTFHGSF